MSITSNTQKKSPFYPYFIGTGSGLLLLTSFVLMTYSLGINLLDNLGLLIFLTGIAAGVGVTMTLLVQKNRALEISNQYLSRYSTRLVDEYHRLNTQVSETVAPLYHRDLEGNFTKVNAAMAQLLGFEEPEQLLNTLKTLGGNFYTSPSRLSDFLFEAEKGRCQNFSSEVRAFKGGNLWVSESVRRVDDPNGAYYEGILQKTSAPHAKGEKSGSLKHAEAMGMVAENIADEMHVPAKEIRDNLNFLTDVFKSFSKILQTSMDFILPLQKDPKYADAAKAYQETLAEARIDYLLTEIPKALEKSKTDVGAVCDLATNIKDYAVNEDQELNLVNLNECIQQAILATRNKWQSLTDLKADLDTELPLIPCLSGEFTTVIQSLIMNAAEAIKDNRSDGLGSITIRTTYDPYNAMIKIVDNGGGIPPEILKKLFVPFFTTKGKGKGQGQGLAYCQNVIAQKHKGDLDIKTELGKGTVVTITIPRAPATERGPVNDQRSAG